MPGTFPKQAIAIRTYKRAYDTPLIAPTGSVLIIIRREADWPGWIWCAGEGGVEAWVPESWLTLSGERAILKKDYNSIELSFQAGEPLTLLVEESGWNLASRAGGDCGWAPAEYVQIIQVSTSQDYTREGI